VPALSEFRALDRRNWSLAGARTVVNAGFSMVLPFMAHYLKIERHQPALVIGVIWAVAGAGGASMQWVAGTLSDHVGRRKVMMVSLVLRAANLAALGYVTASHGRVLLIGLLVIANAVLRAFFDPVANAMVVDLSPPEQRVSAFALQRVGVNIGWTLGTACVGLGDYGRLFYVAAVLTILSLFVVARIGEPPPATSARPPSWREMVALLGDRALVRFLIATVFFFTLQVQLYQALSIYAAVALHLDRAQIGHLYALNGVLVVFLQMSAVGFIRRVGTRRALILGCLGYAVSYGAVGLATGSYSLLFCVACVTLAEIVTAPAQQTTVTSMAPPARVGAYAGLFGLCQVAGQSAGPLIGTALLDSPLPARVAWFVLALFGVAAAAIYRARSFRAPWAQRGPH
jgi:predicted MFS family arabinose efflux permease